MGPSEAVLVQGLSKPTWAGGLLGRNAVSTFQRQWAFSSGERACLGLIWQRLEGKRHLLSTYYEPGSVLNAFFMCTIAIKSHTHLVRRVL